MKSAMPVPGYTWKCEKCKTEGSAFDDSPIECTKCGQRITPQIIVHRGPNPQPEKKH